LDLSFSLLLASLDLPESLTSDLIGSFLGLTGADLVTYCYLKLNSASAASIFFLSLLSNLLVSF
jgi:hypothetical protein